MDQDSPEQTETGQESTIDLEPVDCPDCKPEQLCEAHGGPCPGCLEVAEIMQGWLNVLAWGMVASKPSTAVDPVTRMVCDNCERVVCLSASVEEQVIASMTECENDNPIPVAPPVDLNMFRAMLESADPEWLSRVAYWQPKSARILNVLVKNVSSWGESLPEKLGIFVSYRGERWLTQGEKGLLAARAFGMELLGRIAEWWGSPFPEIPKYKDSSKGSLQYGRPILYFELDECSSPEWVSLSRERIQRENEKVRWEKSEVRKKFLDNSKVA